MPNLSPLGIFAGLKKFYAKWTSQSAPGGTLGRLAAAYANLSNGKYFQFVGDSVSSPTSTYYYSSDGVNWTAGTMPVSGVFYGAAASATRLAVINYSVPGTIYYTTNGTTWTSASTFAVANNPLELIFDGTNFIIAGPQASGFGEGVWISTNAQDWSYRNTTLRIAKIAFRPGFYVGTPISGTSWRTTSDMGTAWTSITGPGTTIGMINGGPLVLAFGGSNYWTSSGGAWTTRSYPTNGTPTNSSGTSSGTWRGAFRDNLYWYGNTNGVFYSADGINWTQISYATPNPKPTGWATGPTQVVQVGNLDSGSSYGRNIYGQGRK